MDAFALTFGLIITIGTITRNWIGKECADKYHHRTVTGALVISAIITAISIYVIKPSMLNSVLQKDNPEYLAIGISFFKGFLLYNAIQQMQIMKKQSLSSAVFMPVVAMGFGSLANSFLGEQLTLIQYYALVGLAFISLIFMYLGHFRELNREGHIAFILSIIIGVSMMASDQYSIPRTNWFSHIFFTSLCFLLCFLFNRNLKKDIKIIFGSKLLLIGAVVWAIREYTIIYAMIEIMPVSIAVFFINLSIPFMMLLSAIKYKEASWKEQISFGILMTIFAVMIVLG